MQQGAGLGSGISDEAYAPAGAEIVADRRRGLEARRHDLQGQGAAARRVRAHARRADPLHVPAPRGRAELANELLKRGVTGVAYETIELDDGRLPLLQPMSAVAGRMAIQVAATYLEKERGGKGILLGGVPGVRRGRVAIIGGGIVGQNAARMAIGLGALVNILDVNPDTLAYVDDIYQGRVNTLYSDPLSDRGVGRARRRRDRRGADRRARARRASSPRTMIKKMEPGSVIVDVAVDQGGCIETCHPTTHDDPTFTRARRHPLLRRQHARRRGAHLDVRAQQRDPRLWRQDRRPGHPRRRRVDPALARGINTYQGKVTHRAVATAVGTDFVPFTSLQSSRR